MVPVISDQLLYDIVNKERTIEQIDVYLFVKKSLDLLTAKNKAEVCIYFKIKLNFSQNWNNLNKNVPN